MFILLPRLINLRGRAQRAGDAQCTAAAENCFLKWDMAWAVSTRGPHLLRSGVDDHQVSILQLAVLLSIEPVLLRVREPVTSALVLQPVSRTAGILRA